MGISKMDYRDILGFSKKPKKKVEKRVAPKPTAPPVTELLKEEFGPLNEWSEKDTGPKRWSKPFDSNMTEFEQRGGKDKVNEGPAYDYAQQWDNIKKTYGAFWDSVHELESLLQSKGMSREAKKVNQMYKKNVEGFFKFVYKLMGKLM